MWDLICQPGGTIPRTPYKHFGIMWGLLAAMLWHNPSWAACSYPCLRQAVRLIIHLKLTRYAGKFYRVQAGKLAETWLV